MATRARHRWLLGLVQMTLLAVMASARSALAVSPLVTDDADTVDPGHLQVNAGWQLSRTGAVSVHGMPVNPVLGVSSRGEVGATFGYQWRDGFGTTPTHADADGITDLTLETKWRVWQPSPDGFRVSVRFDMRVPTASERRGLGTGDVDVSAVVLGTRDWGRTSLDWNVGYTAIDTARSAFGDDVWFLGQAVRHQASARWAVIGEAYGVLPLSDELNGHFSGGAQLTLHESVVLSGLIGTGVGRGSPDVTAYLGFTWTL